MPAESTKMATPKDTTNMDKPVQAPGKAEPATDTGKENKPKPIPVGTSKAKNVTEGKQLNDGEYKKLQAMLGGAQAKDSKTFSGLKGVTTEIADGSIDARATVVIVNCDDCEFTLNSLCTKLVLQSCTNVKVQVNDKIVTAIAEVYKCKGIEFTSKVKIGTLQSDMSRDLVYNFATKDLLSQIVWAGCFNMTVNFLDTGDSLNTGFDNMQEEYANLNEERSQFKLHYLHGKLCNEKVIRLPNGFPTTKREKDEFDAREEANLKILAEKMGIVIPRKKREEPKVGRNEPCSCGSGRKFKKCCG